MVDIKRVTLTKAGEEPQHVEIECDDKQQALALAEAAHDGWRATEAVSVFTTYAVTLVKDGDARTLRIVARDVMGAKALGEEHLPGYEMSACQAL